MELCLPFQPEIELLREPIELLNPHSVRFRYPSEESTIDEAREAIKAAKMIAKFMRDRFPIELLP